MPTFKINGFDCVSAGVLPYFINSKGEVYLLMQKRFNHRWPEIYSYEDWGGKSNDEDECIEMTAAREAEEETNHVLDFLETFKLLKSKNCVQLLNKGCKYVLFLFSIEMIDSDSFGTYEISPEGYRINRVAEWIPLQKVLKLDKKMCHARIRNLLKIIKF